MGIYLGSYVEQNIFVPIKQTKNSLTIISIYPELNLGKRGGGVGGKGVVMEGSIGYILYSIQLNVIKYVSNLKQVSEIFSRFLQY